MLKKIISFCFAMLCSIWVFAQVPTLIGSAKFFAVGSGLTGAPTFNYNIPAGNNRVMVVSVVIERFHDPLNSNFPAGADGIDNNTSVQVSIGGTVINGLAGFTSKISAFPNTRLTTSRYYRYFSEQDGLPTGNTSITLPNLNLPESASDEMSVIVSVYQNVKSIVQIQNSSTFDPGPTGTTLVTATGVVPANPVGRSATEIIYQAVGNSSESEIISLSSGWASTANMSNVVTNSSTVNNVSLNPNEPDGLSHIIGYRTYPVGTNPTVTFTRAGTGQIHIASAFIMALMPLAKPAVTGTVYIDNNGLTGGVNGAGTWNTSGTLWVNAISDGIVIARAPVNNLGVFNFPEGGNLIEGTYITFQLSKNEGIVGSNAPEKELPLGWGTVGESTTSGTSDGTPNGEFQFMIGNANSANNTTNRFGVTACAAGTAAPIINAATNYSVANSAYGIPCGSTKALLSTLSASNKPAAATVTLTWHTATPATNDNLVTNIDDLGGTEKVYAAFYSSVNDCYSATKEITVLAPLCAGDNDFTATPIISNVGGTLPTIFANDSYKGITITSISAITVDRLYELWTPANATINDNGTLTIPAGLAPGTYTYYYKLRDTDPDVGALINDSRVAEVKFRVVIDSDEDGIADETDLDDDNDGILDSDECGSNERISNGVFPTTGGNINTLTGWTVGGTYAASGAWASPTGRINLNTNGLEFRRDAATVSTVTQNLTGVVGGSSININDFYWIRTLQDAASGGFTFTVSYAGTVYATINSTTMNDTTSPILSANNGAGVNTNSFPFVTSAGTMSGKTNIVITLPTSIPSTGALVITYTANADPTEVRGVGMRSISLFSCGDLDEDGIPNSLDLDSDNDGCVDALEGNENVTNAHLVTASGTVAVGFGSTAANQNLGNTVDANGVPIIVNTGGAADIGSDVGQGVGSAYDNLTNPCCTNTAAPGTPDGYTKTGVSSLVGFANGWPTNVPNGFIAIESKNKGFVITRVANTSAITSPLEGMLIYDISANCVKLYNGTVWKCLEKFCGF
ncbi:hypothetical protein [Pedobacter cryotolerans]|uniref:Uncharacterized protein n=1 Tax=Pedobacter cryotolerans TaxID=2571270 RepID=A0A4U1C4F5_9SPHI|nr:hypothetical protein [Pedobacter cryotolerans]TKB98151.1 hypothetical protein FA045_14290 [Pedobacter cryotolerans]